MSKILNKQLDNLMRFVNPTDLKVLANNFILLKDHEGWTNGFIADLTDINVNHFHGVALSKGKIVTRVTTDKDKCPTINHLLEAKETHEVESIQLDLEFDGYLRLNNSVNYEYVNPIYVAYFVKTYGRDIQFLLTENLQNVQVIKDNQIIGLIMPVFKEKV